MDLKAPFAFQSRAGQEPEEIPGERGYRSIWGQLFDSKEKQARLKSTQQFHAIKSFELRRIDFIMMCGDICRSDLKRFDERPRGEVSRCLGVRGINTKVFQMSWRDGGFALSSLEDRQYTVLTRTILDMFVSRDPAVRNLMTQMEMEERTVWNWKIEERTDDTGGLFRWDPPLPDLSFQKERRGVCDSEEKTIGEFEDTCRKERMQDISMFP
jgi:hypothetical protein